VLARGHAISGAAGWLGLCALAGWRLDFDPSPLQIVAGAVVATGFSLLPDLDHPGSTAARSLGPVTRVAARIVSYVSDAVRDGTCDHCETPGTHGHRTLTHTVLFALAAGAGISAAGWRWGTTAAAIVVGIAAGLAVLGLLARRGVWLGAALVGTSAGLSVHWLGGDGWWWLGVPAGFGVLAHIAGDSVTEHGCPVLAPFVRIKGCRWRRLALPEWLAIKTGGWAEGLVSLLMIGGGAFACWSLLAG
jgi:membrane-bound metal-dependent hydrolase YbcI (DUF457 family)